MLDIDLINQFRDVVNENDFTFFKYSKNQNKNHWNCICSAMDWITVAVQHLNGCPMNRVRELGSIEMYSYIASCDIIVEAIQQLHRVIFSTPALIFEKDCDCFPDNEFNQTDLVYFKTIRSCFGAHPVNLNEPGSEENRSMRRFASWSGASWTQGDFSVILYSNQLDGTDIYLSIHLKQILSFTQKYYNHLHDLGDELRQQYTAFCLEMKKRRFTLNGDALTQIKILQEESKLRLNNTYYRNTLDELLLIFSTPISAHQNAEIVADYRKALTVLIDEIYHNLQEMSLGDLENDSLLYLSPDGLPDGWGYWFEKLSESVSGSGYPSYFWLDSIKKIFADHFIFEYESNQELYVLVQSTLYRLTKQQGNANKCRLE